MQESRKDAQALRSVLDKLVESDYKRMGDNVHRFRVLQRIYIPMITSHPSMQHHLQKSRLDRRMEPLPLIWMTGLHKAL